MRPRFLFLFFTALIAFLVVGLSGCATSTGLKDELPTLVGVANKAYFANRFGPPDKQATLNSSTELWEYRLGEDKYTSKTGYQFSTFDRLRLTFRDGRLATWTIKGEVD